MPELRWTDLQAEAGIETAIAHAGVRPEAGDQKDKRRWSEKFADGCAVALADEFRRAPVLRGKRIQPESLKAGTEPLTPLGAGTSKRIDVTITDPVLGLEIGASLKGLNFVDEASGNYDKNLTGRLYELADEVRRERRPAAAAPLSHQRFRLARWSRKWWRQPPGPKTSNGRRRSLIQSWNDRVGPQGLEPWTKGL